MQALDNPPLVQRISRWWGVFRYGLPPDFDKVAYLRLNPDVMRANVDPVEHFLEFGRKEGRSWKYDLPRDFDPTEYLRQNPDVADAKVDPVQHFIEFGRKEGRAWKFVQPTDIPWVAGSLKSDPILVGSHGTANIVAYLDRFWAVPQALGPVNFRDEAVQSHPEIISAKSQDQLIARLDELAIARSSAVNEDGRSQPNVLSVPPNPPFSQNEPGALQEHAKIVDARKVFNDLIPYFRKNSTVNQGLELLRTITAEPRDQSIVPRGEPAIECGSGAKEDSRSRPNVLPFRPASPIPASVPNANMLRMRNPLVPHTEITEHRYAKIIGAQKLISVVIPYFRKESTVFRCLEALRNQTYELCGRDDIEIIIVDDGTPGGTIHERLPDDIHYVWQKKINYGICRAKNTGAKLSNGRYIAFVDPDVLVERHYFDSILRGFSRFGDRVVQTGYVFGYHFFKDRPDFQDSLDPRTEFGVWENPGILTRRFYQVAGLNLVIARDLFSETPGFDEDLIYGGVEDLLFGYHVGLIPGTAVVFNREMEVHHIPHPVGGAHLKVDHTWEIVKRKWPEFHTDYRENGSR